jgi:hypothetical protein
MRMRSIMLGVAVLAGVAATSVAVTSAPAALTDERTCRGTLNAITVDNLRVPKGATCVLNRTRVKGTITVQRKATLKATSIRVVGNIQAENHAYVSVRMSKVGGSIQIVQGGGSLVSGNRVTADIQFFSNRRAISITGNRVDGNLQCKSNKPRPTGGRNIVQGNKEDQCSRL